MKITKGQLKQIIKEELSSVLTESALPGSTSDWDVSQYVPGISWDPRGSYDLGSYDLSDLGGQYGGQIGGWAGEQAGPYFAQDWVPDDLAAHFGRQRGTQLGTQLGTQAGQWGENIFGGGGVHMPKPQIPQIPAVPTDIVQQGVDVAGDVFGDETVQQGVDIAQDVLGGWLE